MGHSSGPNSIVAYCMGIADVDPIELNLYFERFLSPERTSPPDFDIDFSHTVRYDLPRSRFERSELHTILFLLLYGVAKNLRFSSTKNCSQ